MKQKNKGIKIDKENEFISVCGANRVKIKEGRKTVRHELKKL